MRFNEEPCKACGEGVEHDAAFVQELAYGLCEHWHRECAVEAGILCPTCQAIECGCEDEQEALTEAA